MDWSLVMEPCVENTDMDSMTFDDGRTGDASVEEQGKDSETLARYERLFEDGALSQEEFNTLRERLLANEPNPNNGEMTEHQDVGDDTSERSQVEDSEKESSEDHAVVRFNWAPDGRLALEVKESPESEWTEYPSKFIRTADDRELCQTVAEMVEKELGKPVKWIAPSKKKAGRIRRLPLAVKVLGVIATVVIVAIVSVHIYAGSKSYVGTVSGAYGYYMDNNVFCLPMTMTLSGDVVEGESGVKSMTIGEGGRYISVSTELSSDVKEYGTVTVEGTVLSLNGPGSIRMENARTVANDTSKHDKQVAEEKKKAEEAELQRLAEERKALRIQNNGWQIHDSLKYVTYKWILHNDSSKKTYKFVRVRIVFTDDSGNVENTDWTYAVGAEGIRPGESHAFEYMTELDDGGKYYAEIMDYR